MSRNHHRERENHHHRRDSDDDERRNIRIEGGRTVPPAETKRFEGALEGNMSVCGIKIEGAFGLERGVFVFRDCVFANYTMKLRHADVLFDNCIFLRNNDKECDYAIDVHQCTNIQFVDSTIRQTEQFIKFHSNSSGRACFRCIRVVGNSLRTSFATFEGANDVLINDFSYSIDVNAYPHHSLQNFTSNYGILNVNLVCSFQASNVRVATPSVTLPFIRTNSDQLIYITRASIRGPRFMVITAGAITNVGFPTTNNEFPTSVSVPVIPPGGGNPVFVTATSGNNFNAMLDAQTATIIPGSANTGRRDLPSWPWPNRQYVTYSDITFVSQSTVATNVIEAEGNTNIGIVYCNIITNGVNIPVYIHDGTVALLNVVATSFRSRSDDTNMASSVMTGVVPPVGDMLPSIPPTNGVRPPWGRIERITDSVLLEYSAATSYLYLGPLSVSDIGVLLQYPAGGIA